MIFFLCNLYEYFESYASLSYKDYINYITFSFTFPGLFPVQLFFFYIFLINQKSEKIKFPKKIGNKTSKFFIVITDITIDIVENLIFP